MGISRVYDITRFPLYGLTRMRSVSVALLPLKPVFYGMG